MNEICKICNGKGKVDKDFGMGKCKELDPPEYSYRVCPGCDGTGMQYEKDKTSYPSPIIIEPCRKKRVPYRPGDPCPSPFHPPYPYDPCPFPWDPFPRRKKKLPIYISNYRRT